MLASLRVRLPPPWTVHHNDDRYWVQAANGQRFAFVYFRDKPLVGTEGDGRVSRHLARRVASNIAKLPDLLKER